MEKGQKLLIVVAALIPLAYAAVLDGGDSTRRRAREKKEAERAPAPAAI
ncbi:MAG: hypothetical protein ACR2NR_04905 [Solirubrobacteraceae bacterium]